MSQTPSHPYPSDKIVMYSAEWCSDSHRAKYFFEAFGLAYVEIDIEADPVAAAYVQQVNGGRQTIPTIVFPDGSVLVEPSTARLAQQVGVDEDELGWL